MVPPILTLARDLKRRKARERGGRFVAEGVRTVEELLRADLTMVGALVADDATGHPRAAGVVHALEARGVPVTRVDAAAFRSASDTDAPQGILIVADIPDVTLATLPSAALDRPLVLDAIQDPGNVGTLVRTAAALGASAVVALPGTADLWNAKVVRSAAGGHFQVPVLHADFDALRGALRAAGVPLWAADAGGAPLGSSDRPARVALAVGNEGAGVSAAVRDAADRVVALRMAPRAESLNVAVATGILLYLLQP